MLGGRIMTDQEERSLKETEQKRKRNAEEVGQLAKEQVRKKAYLDREQAIEDAQKEKKTKRMEKRDIEESEQLAKEQVRKKAYLANEQTIAEGHEERKLKTQKPIPRG
jgi:hypothetical protein